MTRDEILAKWDAMTPRERDAWVAEAVMGDQKQRRPIPCPDGIVGCAVNHYAFYKPYSTDITAAWEVVTKIKSMKFGVRHIFTSELTNLVRAEGQLIAWPAALFYMNPTHICKAALLAVMSG